jgi:polysaccharide biosynthesis/export protein
VKPQPVAIDPSPAPAAAPEAGVRERIAAPVDTPEAVKDRGAPDDYEIGAGDVLHISVWKEPDASVQSTVVRPDGKISMPLLKEVPVVGLKIVEAERLITQELAKFITAPDVTVVIAAINSKKIYVTGAVKKEGTIPYTYRMTVLQALSEAGGLTDYAKRKKIYVLHNESGRQFLFPFDYDAALKGQRTELNRFLSSGDTVVVPH